MFPLDVVSIRLFFRLLLGLLLLSVALSKLVRPRQFQQNIEDYQLMPHAIEAKLQLSMILSVCIPVAELLAGLGLLSGFWLIAANVLAILLFVVFSGAMIINLMRDRHDLSCHCGGAIGNHTISWWLIGRNGLLIIGLLVLLTTPPDMFTVAMLLRSPSLLSSVFVSTFLPVAILVGAVIAAIALFNSAQVLWHS